MKSAKIHQYEHHEEEFEDDDEGEEEEDEEDDGDGDGDGGGRNNNSNSNSNSSSSLLNRTTPRSRVGVGGKSSGTTQNQRSTAHRSKHSQTEQRRRSKINERHALPFLPSFFLFFICFSIHLLTQFMNYSFLLCKCSFLTKIKTPI